MVPDFSWAGIVKLYLSLPDTLVIVLFTHRSPPTALKYRVTSAIRTSSVTVADISIDLSGRLMGSLSSMTGLVTSTISMGIKSLMFTLPSESVAVMSYSRIPISICWGIIAV